MIKEWCEECDGSGKGNRVGAPGFGSVRKKCKTCQGKGYIEREIKAEELSLDDQRRVADNYENWRQYNGANDWEGLKE